MLIDIAVLWKLPIPLVEPHGNFGGQGNDPPASPHYTEARLSPVGQVALAAERAEIPPVPIGLINGNTHRQGTRPPYRPAAIIEAIRQLLRRPKLTARQINAIVGPPDFFTGCTVTGDLAALAAGQRTELGLRARATVSTTAQVNAHKEYLQPFRRGTDLPVVVLDKFAPYANPDEIILSIDDRVRSHPWEARYPELGEQAGLPIKRMTDISSDRYGFLHVYVPAAGTSAEELRDRLLKVRGVTY